LSRRGFRGRLWSLWFAHGGRTSGRWIIDFFHSDINGHK
jgi:hypothetical protein